MRKRIGEMLRRWIQLCAESGLSNRRRTSAGTEQLYSRASLMEIGYDSQPTAEISAESVEKG